MAWCHMDNVDLPQVPDGTKPLAWLMLIYQQTVLQELKLMYFIVKSHNIINHKTYSTNIFLNVSHFLRSHFS